MPRPYRGSDSGKERRFGGFVRGEDTVLGIHESDGGFSHLVGEGGLDPARWWRCSKAVGDKGSAWMGDEMMLVLMDFMVVFCRCET